ncbi:N-acetylated-alpha-linked acidic dipeptidase-like protein [Toxocara canis]|uniref:N-acetylated-alpha-linked acidic dipeptidase-like protein n=1 Tax=Toxocara canis TaxID=6265 RepID=A0A0B2VL18_TOXCA|nr:N-acetylated-alpha-linked acidic dipeptidase-like protein [Toxocara canis]
MLRTVAYERSLVHNNTFTEQLVSSLANEEPSRLRESTYDDEAFTSSSVCNTSNDESPLRSASDCNISQTNDAPNKNGWVDEHKQFYDDPDDPRWHLLERPDYGTTGIAYSLPKDNRIAGHRAKQANVSIQLMSSFRPLNIRDNIRWLSEKVHVAGTPENAAIMLRLSEQYRSYGYEVKTYDYNVLLSYPVYERPNQIDFIDDSGNWVEVSNGLGERLGPEEAKRQQSDPRGLVYWTAYSQNGTAEGLVVYANYGTFEDYLQLDKETQIRTATAIDEGMILLTVNALLNEVTLVNGRQLVDSDDISVDNMNRAN